MDRISVSRLAASLLVTGLLGACSWWDSESEAPVASQSPSQTPVVHVPVPELFVDPEAEPDEGSPPLTVKFKSNVEDNLGPVECEWDFGDGSPKVKGLEPTHVFEKKADYEVTVLCKDTEGLVGDAEVDVFVE